MRKLLQVSCLSAVLLVGACSPGQQANLSPVFQLGAGAAFTVAQGAAKAYIAAHPAEAAAVQAGLAAAQQGFLTWVNSPPGTSAQQQAEAALQAATTSLLTSLITQGLSFKAERRFDSGPSGIIP